MNNVKATKWICPKPFRLFDEDFETPNAAAEVSYLHPFDEICGQAQVTPVACLYHFIGFQQDLRRMVMPSFSAS